MHIYKQIIASQVHFIVVTRGLLTLYEDMLVADSYIETLNMNLLKFNWHCISYRAFYFIFYFYFRKIVLY